MPDAPIIGVLWYDQQALSCSVQAESGGWSVSLRQTGLPDPDGQEQHRPFRMVRTGQWSLLVAWMGLVRHWTAETLLTGLW